MDFVPETGGGVDLIPRKGLDYGDEPVVRRALDAGDVYYLALLAGLVIDGEELLTLGLGDQLISFSSSLTYSFSSSSAAAAAAAVDVSLVAECRRLVIRDSIALVVLGRHLRLLPLPFLTRGVGLERDGLGIRELDEAHQLPAMITAEGRGTLLCIIFVVYRCE